jgi:hypothetical protein
VEVKYLGARIIEEIENAEPKDIVTAINRAVKTINGTVAAFEIKKLYSEQTIDFTLDDGDDFEVDVSSRNLVDGTIALYYKALADSEYTEIDEANFSFDSETGIITSTETVDEDIDVRVIGWGTSYASYDREHEYVISGGLKKISAVYVNDEKYTEVGYSTVKEYTDEQYYALREFSKICFSEDMETLIIDEDSNIVIEGYWEIVEIDSLDTTITVPARFERCLEIGAIAEMYKFRRYFDEGRYTIFMRDFDRLLESIKNDEINKTPITERNRQYTYK